MGEGVRGKRQSSICSLPVMRGQLKAGRLTGPNQRATPRGSARFDWLEPDRNLRRKHWLKLQGGGLKCWQRLFVCACISKLCRIIYTGIKKGGERKNQFITDVYAEVSPDAYQTVVWVQAAVVSRLCHVRWRSCKHPPITGLTDSIGRVPGVRRTVATI